MKFKLLCFSMLVCCLAFLYFYGMTLLNLSLQANNSEAAKTYMFPNIIAIIIAAFSFACLFLKVGKK